MEKVFDEFLKRGDRLFRRVRLFERGQLSQCLSSVPFTGALPLSFAKHIVANVEETVRTFEERRHATPPCK